MRNLFFVAVSLLIASAAQGQVVQENFETGYALGNPLTQTGNLQFVLGKKDNGSGTFVVPPGIGQEVVAGIPGTGGNFSGALIDTNSTAGEQGSLAVTTAGLLDLNGGNGVQVGTVQVDVTVGQIEYAEINLVDDLSLQEDDTNDGLEQIAHIRIIKNSATFAVRNYTSGVDTQTTAANNSVVIDTTYRVRFTFDHATKQVRTEILGNAPAFDSVILDHTGAYRSSAPDTIKGVRYLGFQSNVANVQPIKFDNLIITDMNVASVANWMAF